MKWSVLFVGVRRAVLWLVAIMGSIVALFTHSVLALCVLLLAIYCLAEGSKIRMLWIMGILSGLMVFVVPFLVVPFLNVTTHDSLLVANSLRFANNGKNIVFEIIGGNAVREAVGESPLWPGVSADFSGATKNYAQAPDAEPYFSDLIASPCTDFLGWSSLAGGGVAAADSREDFLEGDRNVWNVVAGLDENAPDAAPFLFTRNLDITMDDLRNENVDLRTRLDARMKPFGGDSVVVVRKGGAMEVLKRRRLTRETFLGGTVFNQTTNRHATVLKAKGRQTETFPSGWVCAFCGKTNLVDDVCGACVPENQQEQVAKESTPGAAGRIEINRHHECTPPRHTLDLTLGCVLLGVVAIGCAAALLKNRNR